MGGADKCFNCGEEGHVLRDCIRPRRARGGGFGGRGGRGGTIAGKEDKKYRIENLKYFLKLYLYSCLVGTKLK